MGLFDILIKAPSLGATGLGVITMGMPAIDRPHARPIAGGSLITFDVPATGTGKLHKIEIYVDTAMTGVKIGTFYPDPGNFPEYYHHLRDYISPGSLSVGFHSISCNMDVGAGDKLVIQATGGGVDVYEPYGPDATLGYNLHIGGDAFGASQPFAFGIRHNNATVSLYGEGN